MHISPGRSTQWKPTRIKMAEARSQDLAALTKSLGRAHEEHSVHENCRNGAPNLQGQFQLPTLQTLPAPPELSLHITESGLCSKNGMPRVANRAGTRMLQVNGLPQDLFCRSVTTPPHCACTSGCADPLEQKSKGMLPAQALSASGAGGLQIHFSKTSCHTGCVAQAQT